MIALKKCQGGLTFMVLHHSCPGIDRAESDNGLI